MSPAVAGCPIIATGRWYAKARKTMSCFHGIIEKGMIFLLIFTPLAIGTVQQWSLSLMEIIIFIIFCAWCLKTVFEGSTVEYKNPLIVFFVLFIIIALVQIIPLPQNLLGYISPQTQEIYRANLDEPHMQWRTISLYPDATREELLRLISLVMIFIVVVNHYKTKVQVKNLVSTIIVMGCLLAVFAVVQKVTWNGKLFWFYPLREGLRSTMNYIWGPYINHNHFAGYMEMAIPLGFGLLLYKVTNSVRRLSDKPLSNKIINFLNSHNLNSMTFLFLAVLVMTGVLFLSLSRGGIIGFSLSMLFFAIITRTQRSLKGKMGLFMVFGAAILFLIVMASWGRIELRFKEIGEERKIKRTEVWADTRAMVRDFPILGTGLGTFKNLYPRYQTGNPQMLFEHAENDYIEIATDTGVIGFMLILSIVSLFLYSVIKAWEKRHDTFVLCITLGALASCAAIAVHSFTDFNMRIPANALLLTVIAAIACTTVHNITNDHNEETFKKEQAGSRKSWIIACAIILFTGILLSFPLRMLIADYYYNKVADILDDKTTKYRDVQPISQDTLANYEHAIQSLKKASAIVSSRSSFEKALSDIYGRLGIWAQIMTGMGSVNTNPFSSQEAFDHALEHLKRAISLEPTNPDYHLSLGQWYDRLNKDPVLGEREFARATNLYPVNAPLRYAVAMHYLLTGRKGDALEQARILAAVDTGYMIPDSIQKELMFERRTPAYMSQLYGSFLFKALEIAWRVSKDPEVIKGVAPDNPDAKEVVRVFLEWKGIE